MSKMIFINLPVRDLAASTAFYTAIGCTRNDQFSDENASSMAWSDDIIFMLLTRGYYATFTAKPIADAQAQSGMLIALSCDSRAAVDQLAEAAGRSGGKADTRPPQDLGFMYQRSFEDPDGHGFEPTHMDMSAMGGESE